ncbi:regulation of nuclear pre-mRNA domain-containing protein 2 isoform X1 [Echeneis naucrates]|uniref:regulation of nuclear pre-mRNA domain-containing protein 2 isoform X1 n=1 Tax=Echeneis naucrates TaxID=173247 RepID=UPI001114099F|nr:regulation of nuclear pre-mRNA domain-containing protein 2 isoform X1 [Echeneis naucrates]
MAAGAGAASGGSLESTLSRKFQSVTNTMDSIQGLSTWCIDNKKYHSLIVRHWIKCLRKSDAPHRLNLFYLANDVIQNCKRKNAIVYRTAFAEVLPEAFMLVNHESDPKVIKSVERILSIWEERSVYSGTLISELRGSLVKDESPPETPVEQKTPVESKADLQSKIVAEFVPQALIDQLSKYKRSLAEVDLREKQLAAMRVDICSSDALRKLKDKAGGKKFSKDFEEGSAQLQDFVKFLDRQNKIGPPLLEVLSNADIFYEMQYKEVKIVANAYQTFANRVSHLKRKLDSLKATLPDLDDSPIPSPSADAPSPTGSESPFHGLELAHPDPDLDGSAMDDEAEPPAPSPLSSLGGSPPHTQSLGQNDNREVEDMDLSEEEIDSGGIIGPLVSPATSSVVRSTPALSVASQDASSLVNILSKVDVRPADLLSALSKVQGQSSLEGITSILSSPNVSSTSSSTGKIPLSSTSASAVPSQSPSLSSVAPLLPSSQTSTVRQSTSSQVSPQTSTPASALVQALHRDMDLTTDPGPPLTSKSLESKIHSFLQGHPAFSAFDSGFSTNPAGGENLAPVTSTENLGGTPVRDEGGGTPTQDEIMDKPTGVQFTSKTSQSSNNQTAPTAYQNSTQKNLVSSQQRAHLQPGVPQNGQVYQLQSEVGVAAAHYQQISAQTGGPLPRAPGSTTGTQALEGFQGVTEMGWFSDTYTEGSNQQPRGYNLPGENNTGLYPYQAEQAQQDLTAQQSTTTTPGFFRSNLPPVPKLPPPPQTFDAPPSVTSGAIIPPDQQVVNHAGELTGARVSAISGMVVHDHQHKSMFHSDEPRYEYDPPRPHHPEDLHPHPDSLRYREDLDRYHDEFRHRDALNFQDDTYHPPDDPYYRPGSPPHQYPRGRGMTPPLSPSEDPFYAHDYQRHSPPPQHYAPRRPPPPHLDIRHPGVRPLHRPPHPAHHPRGPPRAPFPPFHGPNPRLRGKRPGPRGGGITGPMFLPKRPFPPPRY